MISKDIAVIDCHPDHWTNLVRGPAGPAPGKKAGWLVLVHHDGVVFHAILGGRPLPELLNRPLEDLAQLRRRYCAKRVISLEEGMLRRTFTRAESRLSYDMDYVEQLLTLIGSIRQERGAGYRVDPPTPPGPLPPFGWVQFAFDHLWPDETALVFYVIDEEQEKLFTSLILRKRKGDVDLLTSDLHLAGDGLEPKNWRHDRTRLLNLVATKVAPPYLACFVTLSAYKTWINAPLGSGSFLRLQQNQELVIAPYPRRLEALTTTVRLVARLISLIR